MARKTAAEPRLRIRLLGPFTVEDDRETIHLPTRNAEALLAYLLLHPGPHSREEVAGIFWGEVTDKKARDSLRNELATLRRLLGKRLLESDRQTLALNLDFPLWVDVWALESITSDQPKETEPASPAALDDLYRGELLPGFYDDWVLSKRDKIKQKLISYLLDRSQAARAQSDYRKATEHAQLVLQLDPANERAHQHLMFSHIALGDRTAALRQFEMCKETLREELGVDPAPDTRALQAWIEKPPAWSESPAARISNLPVPLGSLVGRQAELTAIKEALSNHRLVTLTGPGGIGKTRVAIHTASDLVDQYPDGAWWVDLTSINDPDHIDQAVSRAFGLKESRAHSLRESLWKALGPKNALLLIDNCEHVLESCTQLASSLLKHCPNMSILTTSRQPFHLPGERMINILPLSLPDPSSEDLMSSVAAADSANLFIERAQAVRSAFSLSAANAPEVAQICIQLDGIPLALELAASRMATMSLRQIAAHLETNLDLAEMGHRSHMQRHRTLHAAIDWSYQLLTGPAQVLFRRLAVFSGGFSADAASAVCLTSANVDDQLDIESMTAELARLVDHSLLEITFSSDEPRYQMLVTIRRFAEGQLEESPEEKILRRSHQEYFAALVKSAEPHLGFFLPDAAMDQWIGRLEREEGNLRAALAYGTLDPDSREAALQMAAHLHWFWFIRGRFSEGRSWLEQLIEASGNVPVITRARALTSLGFLACWQGNFEAAIPSLEEARIVFQDLSLKSWSGFASHGLGFAASGVGDDQKATELFEESLQKAREVGDRWMIAFSLHFLGIGHSFQEQHMEAQQRLEEAIKTMMALGGNRPGVGYSNFHLARVARIQEDMSKASTHLKDAIDNFHGIGDQRGVAYVYGEAVGLCSAQDQPEGAARMGGALFELQTKLGPLLEEALELEVKERLSLARQQLGEDAYRTALERGRSASMDENIAFLMDLND
ncbi:MAG: AfsR/SARP family transcriptional regulator [Anaerolineales bacterium]